MQMLSVSSLIAGLVTCASITAVQAAEIDLTFLGWSDQHVRTDGTATANTYASVQAMNSIAGKSYPTAIGGTVGTPAFVFGAGDITEWPTYAALTTYKNILGTINYPTYDIAGNHDDGGLSPSPTVLNWLISKHGALSYTFKQGGVNFVAAHSAFDAAKEPAQPISNEALTFIRDSLTAIPKGEPVVVATHLTFTSITNPDALVDAFGDANVVLVMSGHYHQPSVNTYRGINFLQLPSPESTTPAITAVHITSDRVTAVPYNYGTSSWIGGNVVLDAPITVPEPASASVVALGGLMLARRR